MTKWEKSPSDVVVRWGLPARGSRGSKWVIVTHSDDELIKDLSGIPGDTELLIGAPAGQRETERAASAALSSLMESKLIAGGRTDYDIKTLHAIVAYEKQPGVDEAELSSAITAAWAASSSTVGRDLADGELQFEARTNLSGRRGSTTVQGGRTLWLASGASPNCTSGFAADRSTNQGLITAQHCVNTDTYLNLSGVITFGADADSLPAALIDLQFMRATSGNDAGKRFYATSTSDDRYVTNVVNPA